MNNFFALLRKKITQDSPDRNFDQRFWNRFQNEFGTSAQSQPQAVWKKRLFAWLLPSLAAASLAFTLLFSQYTKRQVEVDILTHEQIIDHLDLFLTFEDVSKLKEADWNTLLSSDVNEPDNQEDETNDTTEGDS